MLVKDEEARAYAAQKEIVDRIAKLDEERSLLVQEALKLEGEIRLMRKFMVSEEV